jgi:hypothetical protein
LQHLCHRLAAGEAIAYEVVAELSPVSSCVMPWNTGWEGWEMAPTGISSPSIMTKVKAPWSCVFSKSWMSLSSSSLLKEHSF